MGDTLLGWEQVGSCSVCLSYSTDRDEREQPVALNSLIAASLGF